MRSAAASLLSAATLLAGAGRAGLGAARADTPWPMFHHDVRHTGQSPLLGPLFPSGRRRRPTSGLARLRQGPDLALPLSADGGVLYAGLGFCFCAIATATMTTNWCYHLHADVSDSSPAIDKDGIIYVGDRDNTFTRVLPERHRQISGEQRVRRRHLDRSGHRPRQRAPPPAPSLRPRPELRRVRRRHRDDPRRHDQVESMWSAPRIRKSSPAIGKDGGHLFRRPGRRPPRFQDNGPCPPANPFCGKGVKLWSVQVGTATPGLSAAPVISADWKTLYIGTGTRASPRSTSATIPRPRPFRWIFPTAGKVDQTPALATDGTLYVPRDVDEPEAAVRPQPQRHRSGSLGPMDHRIRNQRLPDRRGLTASSTSAWCQSVYALSRRRRALDLCDDELTSCPPLIGGAADPATSGPAVLYLPSRDHNIYKISGHAHGLGREQPARGRRRRRASMGRPRLSEQTVTLRRIRQLLQSDPGGIVITWSWDFGDGGFGSGGESVAVVAEPEPPRAVR